MGKKHNKQIYKKTVPKQPFLPTDKDHLKLDRTNNNKGWVQVMEIPLNAAECKTLQAQLKERGSSFGMLSRL